MSPNKEKESLIHIDRLDTLLTYNEETGIILSLVSRPPIKVGQRLGCLDKTSGYRYIMIDGIRVLEHRLIWYIVNLEWPVNIIDHIDGNRSNNIYSNLRDVPYKTNSRNKVNNNKLGTNITYTLSNKYMVTILHNKIRKSYGTYTTVEEATYIRDIVTECMNNSTTIPDKKFLKEMAKNAYCDYRQAT